MPDVFQNTEISKKILLNITIKIDNIPLVKPVFKETVELLKCTPPPFANGFTITIFKIIKIITFNYKFQKYIWQ